MKQLEFEAYTIKRIQLFYDTLPLSVTKITRIKSGLKDLILATLYLHKIMHRIDLINERNREIKKINKVYKAQGIILVPKLSNSFGRISVRRYLNLFNNKISGIQDAFKAKDISVEEFNIQLHELKERVNEFLIAARTFQDEKNNTRTVEASLSRDMEGIDRDTSIIIEKIVRKPKNKLSFDEHRRYKKRVDAQLEQLSLQQQEEQNSEKDSYQPKSEKIPLTSQTKTILKNLEEHISFYDRKYLHRIQAGLSTVQRLILPILCYTNRPIPVGIRHSLPFELFDINPGYIFERQTIIAMAHNIFYSSYRNEEIKTIQYKLKKRTGQDYVPVLADLCFMFDRVPNYLFIWMMPREIYELIGRPVFTKTTLAFSNRSNPYISNKEERLRELMIIFNQDFDNKANRLKRKIILVRNNLKKIIETINIVTDNIVTLRTYQEIHEQEMQRQTDNFSIRKYYLQSELERCNVLIDLYREKLKKYQRRKIVYSNIAKSFQEMLELKRNRLRRLYLRRLRKK